MPKFGKHVTETSAVLRALVLLERVAGLGDAATLEEISAIARLPKPTIYRVLRLLSGAGWLSRQSVTKRYSPGARLHALAMQVSIHSPLHAERHVILEQLVRELGETCNLTMLDGGDVVYVDRVETSSPVRLNMEAGSRVPLHCTASGKLFLSKMPHERVLRLLGPGLKRYTARTTTDARKLLKELERIRKEGVSVDEGEYLEGSVCLAVPVMDRKQRYLAAVAVHGPSPRLNLRRVRSFVPRLRQAADAIAKSLLQYGAQVLPDTRPTGAKRTAYR